MKVNVFIKPSRYLKIGTEELKNKIEFASKRSPSNGDRQLYEGIISLLLLSLKEDNI